MRGPRGRHMMMLSVCDLRSRDREYDNTRLDQLSSYVCRGSSLVHFGSSDHKLTSTLFHSDRPVRPEVAVEGI